jgi:nucleoid-associated protein YgaU
VAQQGDTLWSIAAAEYGDARQWRPIAEANQITNPRELKPGQTLIVPSVE